MGMRHPVQEKVRSIQRRAWRLRAVCAGGLWLCGAVGAVFLAALADYCLRLDDTGVRLLSSFAVLAVCGWCLWRFVAPVFMRRLSELEVAQRIEQRFPQLCDRLSSAVAFLGQAEEQPAAGSPDLRRAVVATAVADLDRWDFAECLDTRRPRRIAIGACRRVRPDRSRGRLGLALRRVGDAALGGAVECGTLAQAKPTPVCQDACTAGLWLRFRGRSRGSRRPIAPVRPDPDLVRRRQYPADPDEGHEVPAGSDGLPLGQRAASAPLSGRRRRRRHDAVENAGIGRAAASHHAANPPSSTRLYGLEQRCVRREHPRAGRHADRRCRTDQPAGCRRAVADGQETSRLRPRSRRDA